jgi:hypothetical protein
MHQERKSDHLISDDSMTVGVRVRLSETVKRPAWEDCCGARAAGPHRLFTRPEPAAGSDKRVAGAQVQPPRADMTIRSPRLHQSSTLSLNLHIWKSLSTHTNSLTDSMDSTPVECACSRETAKPSTRASHCAAPVCPRLGADRRPCS